MQPALCSERNDVDRFIRLVMTASGPEFRNAAVVCSDASLRRVRNLYYTSSFGHLVYQECILNRCKALDVGVHCYRSSCDHLLSPVHVQVLPVWTGALGKTLDPNAEGCIHARAALMLSVGIQQRCGQLCSVQC